MIIEELVSGGFSTPRALLLATSEALASVPGVSSEMVDRVLDCIRVSHEGAE